MRQQVADLADTHGDHEGSAARLHAFLLLHRGHRRPFTIGRSVVKALPTFDERRLPIAAGCR
jgi:hypothetical protein